MAQRFTYRMTVQYLGSGFCGWQVQARGRTVQGVLEEVLGRLQGERVRVVGAGRTDAGVHALGQVAHFRLPKSWPPSELLRALNALLPPDVRVRSVRRAPSTFHAQRQARCKLYEYRVFTGPVLSPFWWKRACHWRSPLRLELLNEAASQVLGRHDFSGFTAAASRVRNRVRTVDLSHWRKRGAWFRYRIRGDGFLHHMVRNLVGSMLEIGQGKRPPADMERILREGERGLAGPTAPAEGLYLVRVWYQSPGGGL